MTSKLLEETLTLAKAPNRPIKAICDEAGLSTRWFYKLVNGDIPDPGINRIERLREALLRKAAA